MSGPLPEPEVAVGTSRRLWIALLAGPSLWFGHFMAVYLAAEVLCAASDSRPGAPAGSAAGADAGVSVMVGAVTVLALVVLAVAARMTWTYRDPVTAGSDGHRDGDGDGDAVAPSDTVLLVGLGLDALFAVGILFTAVPVVVLSPC